VHDFEVADREIRMMGSKSDCSDARRHFRRAPIDEQYLYPNETTAVSITRTAAMDFQLRLSTLPQPV